MLLEVSAKPRVPVQFVLVLRGVDLESIRDVRVDDGNTADDNAALMRLAERIIQQQDAAVTAPAAIRATIPQKGRLRTFRRTLQVEKMADLRIAIEAKASHTASRMLRLGTLAAVFIGFAFLAWVARRARRDDLLGERTPAAV